MVGLKCHICGKWTRASDMENHLRKRHSDFYRSRKDYVLIDHTRSYGKDRGRRIDRLFFGRSTIPGMVIGFVTLILFAVLANATYPIAQQAAGDNLDPSFLFMINAGFLIIGVGIIVALWKDMTRGGQEVYVRP